VGQCNHEICGRCSLRQRLCYNNNRCPLCNTDLKEASCVLYQVYSTFCSTSAPCMPKPSPETICVPLNLLACCQVVITSWLPELPSYADFEQHRSELWQRPAWARGVLVDDRVSKSGPPLHVKMQHVSARPSAVLPLVY